MRRYARGQELGEGVDGGDGFAHRPDGSDSARPQARPLSASGAIAPGLVARARLRGRSYRHRRKPLSQRPSRLR